MMFNLNREASNVRGWLAREELLDRFHAPTSTLGDLGRLPLGADAIRRAMQMPGWAQFASQVAAPAPADGGALASQLPPWARVAAQVAGRKQMIPPRRRRRFGGFMPNIVPRSGGIRSAITRGAMMRGHDDELGDIWDDLKAGGQGVLNTFSAKADRLENAIKIIMVLSGVAAATGALTFLTGGMPHLTRR